jgi:hypothetical protein
MSDPQGDFNYMESQSLCNPTTLSTSSSTGRPSPLKQRTSSMDTRKDYSYFQTWWSLRDLVKRREWFIPVNNFPIWRRHLAWALENGGDLRNYMTSRYSSSMVFLSLLLATELNVLFNSSPITTNIRHALQNQLHLQLQFWIGIIILVSIILTLFSLIITYTAWGMVSAISDENAHCILRSSIGQYIGELPHRFIVASIYTFLLWIIIFIFLLIPMGFWSMLLVLMVLVIFIHVMTAFSSFGRLILHTAAMSPNPIFDESYEKSLTPQPLQEQLYTKARAEILNNTSITRQYRRKLKPLSRRYSVDELVMLLREAGYKSPVKMDDDQVDDGVRMRANSTVRFVDQLLTTPNPDSLLDNTPDQENPPSTSQSSSPGSSVSPNMKEQSVATKGGEPHWMHIRTIPENYTHPSGSNTFQEWLSGSTQSDASSSPVNPMQNQCFGQISYANLEEYDTPGRNSNENAKLIDWKTPAYTNVVPRFSNQA